MKTKFKKQKGITLIALVITVIVLLILAGTAITVGLSGDGLFERTNSAVEKWNNKVSEEENAVNEVMELLKEKKAVFADGLITKTHFPGCFNITKIERAIELPQIYRTDNNKVSTEDSDYPIYMWNDNNVLYWYSEIKHPELPSDSSYIFSGYSNLTDANGIRDWNTSNVTNMTGLFNDCKKLAEIDVSQWNTSNVTNMSKLFYQCASLDNLDLINWNTNNVTNMSLLFYGCANITELDLSTWNTSFVTTMDLMFSGTNEHFNDKNGNDIYDRMNIRKIIVTENFTVENLTSNEIMFRSCTQLVGGNGTSFDFSKQDSSMAHIDTAGSPGYFSAN